MSDLRICALGDGPGLTSLAFGLERRGGFEVVDAAGTPDVILLGARHGVLPAEALSSARSHTGVPVVLVCPEPTPALLEWASVAAIADVVLVTQPIEAIAFGLQKLVRAGRVSAVEAAGRPEPARKVVAVFSPKGGTGKSTLAVNLATALAEAGRRILLVDFDLEFGDASIMLGLEPAHSVRDLAASSGELDAEKLAAFTLRHSSGIELLPSPLRPEEADRISEAQLADVLTVAADAYDAVVVDTAPSFDRAMLATLDHADELMLVCTQAVPALKDVRLALETLRVLSFDEDRVHLLLNRIVPERRLSRADVAAVLDRRVELELPHDPAVAACTDRGVPAVVASAQSPYVKTVRGLAAGLFGPAAEAERAPQRRSARALLRERFA